MSAQSPEGRFKLGLETAILEYTSTETSAGSGVAVVNDSTDEVSFGVAPARSGFDLAYGLSDEFVLGARLLLVHSSSESAPGTPDVDTTVFGIVPHLDYVFPSDGNTRVFLGPMVGFGLADVEQMSVNLFIFGASFGAHIFAARGVSIDPRLSLAYAFGESTYELAIGPLTTDVSADVNLISVSAMLGISAWL